MNPTIVRAEALKFLESVKPLIEQEAALPEQEQKKKISKVVEQILENARDLTGQEQVSLEQISGSVFPAQKIKLDTMYQQIKEKLSKRLQEKLDKELSEINKGSQFLFSEDQRTSLLQLLTELKTACDSQRTSTEAIEESVTGVVSKVNQFLSIDEGLRTFEAVVTLAHQGFKDAIKPKVTQAPINRYAISQTRQIINLGANNLHGISASYPTQLPNIGLSVVRCALHRDANSFWGLSGDVGAAVSNYTMYRAECVREKASIKENLDRSLNVPEDKREAVFNSEKYKRCLRLACALAERIGSDDLKARKKREWKIFREMMFNSFGQLEKDLAQACDGWDRFFLKAGFYAKKLCMYIGICYEKIKDAFEYVLQLFVRILDYCGLLPETWQIAYTKPQGSDWQVHVCKVRAELDKEFKLTPLAPDVL